MLLSRSPAAVPRIVSPPREPDVAVIGAGAAGLGATRRLIERGLSVAVIEARGRVGGRAHTALLRGHPVDLGAHWLHAGPINPLVKLGFERGERLLRAPQEGHLVVGSRLGTRAESARLDRAFTRADEALTRGARSGEDRPAAEALPTALGLLGRRVATIHGLVCGRPLDEVSLHDFPSLEYGDNYFLPGGYGSYLARLAHGLPVRLACAARSLDWSGDGVRIETSEGTVRARAAVVTLPMTVLQAGGLRFSPALPEATEDAIDGFTRGTYEHVVLHWPSAPFAGRDRLASLVGTRHPSPGMLTRLGGTPFHYFELDHPTVDRLRGGGPDAAARYARLVLADHFGHRAIRDLTVVGATDWRGEQLSLGSWAVVPPGRFPIRDRMRAPVGERIWFAGEALSREQWGTVGGAWAEGEQAAEEIAARLT